MHNTGSNPAGMPANAGELDWLAFRYIAGELSPAETITFEARLEGDLSACEAVARAVQLAEVMALGRGVCHAEVEDHGLTSRTARQPRRRVGKDARPGRRWAPLALTGIAALLVVGVISLRDEPRVATQEPSVVGIWADSWHADLDAQTTPAEATTEVAQTADTQDLVAPGWLLAAVNGNAAATANVDEPEASIERQEN